MSALCNEQRIENIRFDRKGTEQILRVWGKEKEDSVWIICLL